MKKLDDFINQNRSNFDDLELPDGHEKRFLKKLNKKRSIPVLKIWYGVAAGFIFLAMLSFFAKDFILKSKLNDHSQLISLSDISPRYQEVEEFYKSGVNAKIEEIDKLNCRIDNEQKVMISKELDQLNGSYRNLQAELKTNMNDQRIINAMISNYQNRIQFLEQVIDQIKENC